MFAYVDNCLPEDLFKSLNARMLKRFRPNMSQDEKPHELFALRIRANIIENNDFTDGKFVLGVMVPEAAEHIKSTCIEKFNFVNPMAYSLWFQYMSNKQMVGKHFDFDSIRGRKSTQCFSTFLYTHKVWEDGWGGEICFNSGMVLPKPNRLVIYSRDEEHWVNPILHNNDEYQRMFLGISWSTDNDF